MLLFDSLPGSCDLLCNVQMGTSDITVARSPAYPYDYGYIANLSDSVYRTG